MCRFLLCRDSLSMPTCKAFKYQQGFEAGTCYQLPCIFRMAVEFLLDAAPATVYTSTLAVRLLDVINMCTIIWIRY